MKSLATAALSVLDLAKVPAGGTIGQAFENSVALAQSVEKLGYRRFWLAEHHNFEGIASAATSVLIGHIASKTKTLRVGSGGVMLPNHAPMVIAEQFGTLATLYPGRIDLGLGRAPGTDALTMRALRGENFGLETDFGVQIEELRFFFAPAQPEQRVRAVPGAGVEVPLYILGSSLYSARLAGALGLPYAFAGHFAPALMDQAFGLYREEFRPSEHLENPYVMLGVPVIAADTDERAKFLSSSVQQSFLSLIRGDRRFSQPPVDNIEALWSPDEKAAVERMLSLLTTGGVQKIRRDLDTLIKRTGADELIITCDTYDVSDRLHSYELVAQAQKL